MARFTSMMARILLLIIKGYQNFISPVLPARCRYYPTCSEYGKQAIQWHGAGRGGLLTLKRVCRCHPLGGHGIDFVPLPLYRYLFYPINNDLLHPYHLASNRSNLSKSSPAHQPKTDINSNLSFVSRETKIVERGVYKDSSSYRARLNAQIRQSR
ncbi:membrane protein insertion efficiency factor YidD [Psychrobacter sp. FDAARGOS_221]|uniref:membrane protein insertion efficiency factor YidD n=1 Tax=Psychrobacter sp. FDAARGOS_221 TaxID=1975705 RepID=UPI000BB57230|nr:membrane protein insertion efficiency factor YidD [Psychrobacter sp. FDAARGOS_221]PNK60764.1 membrane protein insertion efficiency factor YidD [Psychrobacter sp. FDAARGOS_221]